MGSTGATLLRALLFASLFAGFAAHLAAGEKDCYDERDSVMRMCKWTIKKGGPYAIPDMPCRLEVSKVDMPCICRVLTAADERIISPEKLVRCSRDSGVALPVGSKCGTTIRACVRSSDHGIVREEGEGRAGGDVRGE